MLRLPHRQKTIARKTLQAITSSSTLYQLKRSTSVISKLIMKLLSAIVLAAFAVPCNAQGTLTVALQQQFNFTGCTTAPSGACGTPLAGGLLYFYQVGTVATPQNSYQDSGLSILNPWPLVLDANGRIPMFYLASGFVSVRLTDQFGVVQFSYPSTLVIGPSGGGGGGGPSIDPTTIASTGDIKFRATSETLTGWVVANGQTIGSATSGATGRANADTSALFTYLWTNCANPTTNRHCPVVGGIGASAAADFAANKQITLFDFRDSIPVGLDSMGNSAKGGLLASNMTSGGGDGVNTPNASGGEANHTLVVGEIPAITPTFTDPGHIHNVTPMRTANAAIGSGSSIWAADSGTKATTSATTGITVNSFGGGAAHNNMPPFLLGSFYIKL
jgi:hypothetical protein